MSDQICYIRTRQAIIWGKSLHLLIYGSPAINVYLYYTGTVTPAGIPFIYLLELCYIPKHSFIIAVFNSLYFFIMHNNKIMPVIITFIDIDTV